VHSKQRQRAANRGAHRWHELAHCVRLKTFALDSLHQIQHPKAITEGVVEVVFVEKKKKKKKKFESKAMLVYFTAICASIQNTISNLNKHHHKPKTIVNIEFSSSTETNKNARECTKRAVWL
jgi:hypothetical protein